jgi:formate dehydrogenase maturation protein FdhE
VRYSAHELESPAGVMALHDRLTAAVAQSCAPLDGRSLARLEAYRHCLSTLLAAAVRDVRSPALAALHEARTGEHIDVAQPVIQLAGETHPAGSVAR